MDEPAPKKSSALKWVLGCLGCGVLCLGSGAALIGVVTVLTMPLEAAARRHVDLVKAGQVRQAYDECAESMREQTSFAGFEAFVKEYSVLYQSSNLRIGNRRINNAEGKAEGSVELADGTTVPVRFLMLKEGEVWRITFVGVGDEADVPEAAAKEHVRQVASGNVKQAYNNCSKDFQASTALDRFREFARDSGVYGGTPVFTQRTVAGNECVLSGTVTPSGGEALPVRFTMARGQGGWRVHKIDAGNNALSPKNQ